MFHSVNAAAQDGCRLLTLSNGKMARVYLHFQIKILWALTDCLPPFPVLLSRYQKGFCIERNVTELLKQPRSNYFQLQHVLSRSYQPFPHLLQSSSLAGICCKIRYHNSLPILWKPVVVMRDPRVNISSDRERQASSSATCLCKLQWRWLTAEMDNPTGMHIRVGP